MNYPERNGIITFANKDITIIGQDLKVGDIAPEFTAQAQDWSNVAVIESSSGKIRVIASLPSLNTTVCDRETRRFNQEATNLGTDIAIFAISMDLPFTLKNWCAAAGVERVTALSDHMEADFSKKYGVLMKEVRAMRRAVFVVNRQNRITYVAYMPSIGTEPDYDAVLQAVRTANESH